MAKPKLIRLDNSVHFALQGHIVPKARPRLGKGRKVYMPKNYLSCKDWVEKALLEQYVEQGLLKYQIRRCHMTIEHFGDARGDADNISGTIMDCLVKCGILDKDNVNTVPDLQFRHMGSCWKNGLKMCFVDLTSVDVAEV